MMLHGNSSPFACVSCLLGMVLMGMVPIRNQAADWPQYRGLSSDGSSSEFIRINWEEQPPVEIWRRPIGQGFSSIVVKNGRVFTQAKRRVAGEDREFCVCLDASTGIENWSVSVDRAAYDDLVGYDEAMDGPRSTPSVDENHVYVLTSYLKLYRLKVEDGEVEWMRDFRAELGSFIPSWQNAASPLLVGDFIYLNANTGSNSILAIHKSDGTIAWRTQNDPLTHATPVFTQLHDTPQILFLTLNGLVSLHPDSGDALWRFDFDPSSTSTAASPLVAGEFVHASSAYAGGTWLARIQKTENGFDVSPLPRQRANSYQIHWSSPVHHQGFIYGIPSPSSSQARLVCLDLESGENRWQQSNVGSGPIGYGSLIQAANALIVLTESGELVLVQPDPEGYLEMGRYSILDRYCWNSPTLANGRLYARNTSPTSPEIVAFDIARVLPTLPDLELSIEYVNGGNGDAILSVRGKDGIPLDPTTTERLEILSASNVPSPLENWTHFRSGFLFNGGVLEATVRLDTFDEQYYLVRERTVE